MLKNTLRFGLIGGLMIATAASSAFASSRGYKNDKGYRERYDEQRANYGKPKNNDCNCDPVLPVQLGPRPAYLVADMSGGPLKNKLLRTLLTKKQYQTSSFSIGHRGAPLQFPEHTRESYIAAAVMGAGILECDVAITKDLELVCRHSQSDLHTTTDILLRPELAAKCTKPFSPAEFDPVTGELLKPASALCRTTDITLAEFKSLCGKMDASNPRATTPEEYVKGTANYRTDLYSTCGTLMTHAESIELFDALGLGMTPELKNASIDVDGDGEIDMTQSDFALKMIDEYRAAGIKPKRVWPQSFNYEDVLIWVNERPRFGRQAVFLDGRYDPVVENLELTFDEMVDDGVRVIAPPMWVLLTTNSRNKIVPSDYARKAKAAGLDIITWSSERSGRIVEDVLEDGNAWYYQTTLDAIKNDGDILTTIDVLARKVGVLGIFSDWPATTTFYANAMKLKLSN